MNIKKIISTWLLVIAGIFFIISAIGHGIHAIPDIKNTIKDLSPYWLNRIYTHTLLVNLSMWMIGILVLYGAYALTQGRKNHFVILIAALYAFLMATFILILTPSDWWHTILLFSGSALIFISLTLKSNPTP